MCFHSSNSNIPSIRVVFNCFSDPKKFANSWPSASNFKSFSRSQDFFLKVGQNNNKKSTISILKIEQDTS